MTEKKISFRQAVEAACRSHPELWGEDKNGMPVLNVSAVVRHYRKHGYNVTQGNLHRILRDGQRPGQQIIDATAEVFRLPRVILRGEPLPEQMERQLGKSSLDTLLLAERLEGLDRDDFIRVAELIGHLEEKREKLRKAMADSPNVKELPRRSQP